MTEKNSNYSDLKFYSLKNILKKKAQYNIIFGERSNGKTYSVLEYAIKKYIETGEQLAIVRRFQEDYKGKRGQVLFDAIVANGMIKDLTLGKWSSVYYYAGKWYLAKYDEKLKKTIHENNPFAYAFAISSMEHDKSTSYPNITTILFDEFLSRNGYFPDEFVIFMNVLSTIIRYRNNVKIFMLGNTVNKYCPYFAEMGLRHITEMKKGNIDVYTYGNSKLKVAVEYADSIANEKPSDVYFAFDNPKLNMITGGEWELAFYPHLPYKYKPNQILFTFFIEFADDIIQCEIIQNEVDLFIYCHKKTTPIKDRTKDLIFSLIPSPSPNIRKRIFQKTNIKVMNNIIYLFNSNKVFYQSNDIGEIVRNYILSSEKTSIIAE